MSQFTQQQIEESYKKLPAELKEAIFSTDVADKLFSIGRKFALTIEKNGFLADETGYVMLGLTKLDDFTGEVRKRLEVDDEEAKEIVNAVNEEIFFPVREALKGAHQFAVPGAISGVAPQAELREDELTIRPEQTPKPSFSEIAAEMKAEAKKEFSPSSGQPLVLEKKPASQEVTAPAPASQVPPIKVPPAPVLKVPLPQEIKPQAAVKPAVPQESQQDSLKTPAVMPITPKPSPISIQELKTAVTARPPEIKRPAPATPLPIMPPQNPLGPSVTPGTSTAPETGAPLVPPKAPEKPKIPPIDLRPVAKPEIISGAIFSAPAPKTIPPSTEAESPKRQPTLQPPASPRRNDDPYREPIE